MWNDITAGVASTVTCPLHFLELGLELTHQGKSDLVKGEQSGYLSILQLEDRHGTTKFKGMNSKLILEAAQLQRLRRATRGFGSDKTVQMSWKELRESLYKFLGR